MPRYAVTQQRSPSPDTIPLGEPDRLGIEFVRGHVERQALAERGRCTVTDPYTARCPHSFFRDLLAITEAQQRKGKALESPVLRGRDQGALDFSDAYLEEARQRLRTVGFYPGAGERRARRDLSSASLGDGLRASAPSYLLDIWGRASRATGTLAAAFGTRPLEAGMVDTSGSVPVVSIPRLTGGAAVAVQASENAAVSEVDPTSSSASSPMSTLAGQVDMSRQAFEFSRPGLDAAIANDLARDYAAKQDVEIVNGTAASGRTRGLLAVTGILSVTGSVASAQAFLGSLWQAFSAIAGTSGSGASDFDDYLTILHPRRAAWLISGGTAGDTSIPGSPLVPGRLVISRGLPTSAGAGTNEDVALVVERSQVLLLERGPEIAVYEQVGSGTLTVRTQARSFLSVLVQNPAAVAKVVGLTPPTGF